MVRTRTHANYFRAVGRNGRGGAAKAYQLSFLEEFDRQGDDDFQEDLQEATELPICQAAWTTLFNLGRTSHVKIKLIAEGGELMIHGNTGKRNVDNEREKAYLKSMEILQDLQDNHATLLRHKLTAMLPGIPISETTTNLFFFHLLSQSTNCT